MSNYINSVSYAVEIQTTYTDGPIPEIGMDSSGRLLYVTDDIDTSTGFYYDDGGAPVTDVYKRDFLVKKGVKPSNQKMKLIEGGDYAFLGSFTCEISNYNSLFERLLKTNDLYLIGAPMTLYIILDDLFIKSWSGSIGGHEFGASTFTFIGKDNNNSDNNTVKDTVFGLNDTTFVAIAQDQYAFIPDQTIKASDFGSNTLGNNNYINPNLNNVSTDPDLESDSNKFFNGVAHYGNYKIADNHNNGFTFHLNGWKEDISVGMLVTFGKTDVYYTIRTVYKVTDLDETGLNPAYATAIEIDEVPDGLIDYTQFYGLQPWDVRLDPNAQGEDGVLETTEAFLTGSQEKLIVDVYDRILSFPIPEGSEWVTDSEGKYLGTDSEGNDVSFVGVLDTNGNLQISNSTSYDIVYATDVKYVTLSDDNVTLLREGKLKHIESLPTTTMSISNDLQMDGKFTKTPVGKSHGIRFNMDNFDGNLPFMLLNNMVYADESWNDRFQFGASQTPLERPAVFYGSNYTGSEMDAPTTYLWNEIDDDTELINNKIFSQYEVEVYKIFINEDWGEVPELLGSFTLPNYTHVVDKRYDSNYDWSRVDPRNGNMKYSITMKGASTTNLPVYEINSDDIAGVSTGHKICVTSKNQVSWVPMGNTYEYPDGLVDNEYYSSELIATEEYMYVITPSYVQLDRNDTIRVLLQGVTGDIGPDGDHDFTIAETSFSVGINSIGSFKTTKIESIDDISFKTVNSSTDTYSEVIKQLSGSQSTFRNVVGEINRTDWWVGNQITDEQNTFNIVTNLCQQGFVAGFTDRKGDVILSEFLQDMNDDTIPFQTHSTGFIIDGSVKPFKLSDISKCWNEFTVKYNNGEKSIGVYNVDADQFPAYDEYDWETYPENGTGNTLFRVFNDTVSQTQATIIAPLDGTANWNRLPPINSTIKVIADDGSGVIATGVYSGRESLGEPLFINVVYNGTLLEYYNTRMEDVLISTSPDPLWKSYVTGSSDYAESKELWDSAHNSWLINHRIRTAPTKRTNLEWCIDRGEFYSTDDESFYTTYQWEYTKQLVEWSTRQKYQIVYSVPLDYDTARLNLMDKILFSFDFGTGNGTVEGRGWLTSIKLDSVNSILTLEVTFEQDFMTPEDLIPLDNDIWEQQASVPNIDDIVEDPTNTDDIYEPGVVEYN